MRAIRRKIYFVVVLLVGALALLVIIYLNGGFGFERNIVGYNTTAPTTYPIQGYSGQEGEKLFKANCTSCHAMDKKLTGPAIMGATDRVPYKNFIEDLLLNPKRTQKQSDYARQLSKEYGDNGHMDFSGILSKTEIKEIISYTKFYTPKATDQIMARSN